MRRADRRSTWLGERCDYDTWIMGLLFAERRAARQAAEALAAA